MELNTKINFTEMSKLFLLLADAEIPCEVIHLYDGLQINYPSVENRICDVICHSYSYGHEKGLLEIMGLVNHKITGDSVEGWLTAEDVFKRISKHYRRHKGAEAVTP